MKLVNEWNIKRFRDDFLGLEKRGGGFEKENAEPYLNHLGRAPQLRWQLQFNFRATKLRIEAEDWEKN